MLVPAICYKEELLRKFAKEIYTERYFFYTGYGHSHNLPVISETDSDNIYQYAIVDKKKNVIGWFAYKIYVDTQSAENFGLYAFDDEDYSIMRNALVLGHDVFNKMEELVNTYHRVSWRLIQGNPIEPSYDRFCAKHNGNKVVLHDVTVDPWGQYRGESIFEIINPEK